MEQQVRVLGLKGFNDKVDGTVYNFCKVRLELPVPRTSKTEVGTNVVEALFGDYENFIKFKDVKFPCACIVDLEMSTKGVDVMSLRPVEAAKVKVA